MTTKEQTVVEFFEMAHRRFDPRGGFKSRVMFCSREVYATCCVGRYGAVSSVVLHINGSPPKGTFFCNLEGQFEARWLCRGKSSRLGSRETDTVKRFLDTNIKIPKDSNGPLLQVVVHPYRESLMDDFRQWQDRISRKEQASC